MIKVFLGWYQRFIDRGDGEAGGEDPELPDRPANGHGQVEADPWRRDGGPSYLHRQTQETYRSWYFPILPLTWLAYSCSTLVKSIAEYLVDGSKPTSTLRHILTVKPIDKKEIWTLNS